MEIQKELKALTKELRPKKKKERMEEAEEDKNEEEKVETKEMNDVLESYHKEKKRYAEAKASKPIPKQKVSDVDNSSFFNVRYLMNNQPSFVLSRQVVKSRPSPSWPSSNRNCQGSSMTMMTRRRKARLKTIRKPTKKQRLTRRKMRR